MRPNLQSMPQKHWPVVFMTYVICAVVRQSFPSMQAAVTAFAACFLAVSAFTEHE